MVSQHECRMQNRPNAECGMRNAGAAAHWGATKPGGLFRENPSGGGSFADGRRWLGRHSPLRGAARGQGVLAVPKPLAAGSCGVLKQPLRDRGCPPDAQNHGSQFYLSIR